MAMASSYTTAPFIPLPYSANLTAPNNSMFVNYTIFPTRSFPNPIKIHKNSFYSSSSFRHRLQMRTCAASLTMSTTKQLNVTIHRSSLVAPMKETEKRSMFLSNIDQTLNLKVGTVFFFAKNPDFCPETVVEMLETAYRQILVPYDYVAGRLKYDQQGRLVIDCNSAGAGFVVASSNLSLEELGDLVSPNPEYKKLAVRKLIGFHAIDQPLLVLQITSFKCGGFAMGLSSNHILFDGIGYKIFLENLAQLANKEPLICVPQSNRQCLSARSPPQITFPHPEFYQLDNSPLDRDKSKSAPLLSSFKKNQSKAFYLRSDDIIKLKELANMGPGENNKQTKVTDFNVVVAHIWRCMILAKDTGNQAHKECSILFAVNIRARLQPRLPSSHTGNAIYNAYCATTNNELKVGSFSHIVQMITQAEKQITGEYVRSGIDWRQVHKGFMYGDILVSSWWKLGYNDTKYPWGKPKWTAPVLQNHGNNAVLLLPDIEGTANNGVNIIVSLQPKEMEKFQILFNRFLEKDIVPGNFP